MATVVPNRMGEALERSTQNLMNMILQSRQFELEEQRIGIAERAQREAERTSALNRLLSFAPFLPEGKSIAETPQIHDTLKQVFPEFDPTNPGDLGGIVLNEETLEDVMKPLLRSEFERMGPEAKSALTERALNRQLLGEAVSGTELEAGETRSRMMLQAWETLRRDPIALDGILRTQMGLQQPIRVRMPDGRVLQWDTGQAASLSVQLAMHTEDMGLRRRQISSEASQDIAGELMKQMEAVKQPISRAGATAVIQAYNRRVELANSGQLTNENDPINALINGSNPDLSAAAQFFMGAGQIGEQSLDRYLQNSGPAGQQVRMGLSVMETLGEFGVPAEEIIPMTDRLLENLGGGEPGSPFPGFSTRKFFGPGPGFEITAPNAEDVQSLNQPANAPLDRETATLQAIRDVVGSGRATREQAIARFGSEVVGRALDANVHASAGSAAPTPPRILASPHVERANPNDRAITETTDSLSRAQRELEQFLAPVAGRSEEQRRARENSATGRRLRARIESLQKRLNEISGR